MFQAFLTQRLSELLSLQSLFSDGLVIAGRWWKPMLAKPDNSSASVTFYFYACRSLSPPFGYSEFPELSAAKARDILGGSVRFLSDQNKVAARLELLASKTYGVWLEGVKVLYADDIPARHPDGTPVLDSDGKAVIMTDGAGLISMDLVGRIPRVSGGALMDQAPGISDAFNACNPSIMQVRGTMCPCSNTGMIGCFVGPH